MDKSTEAGKSFSTVKILLTTCLWHNIHGWISLSINGMGFDVFVKEAGVNNIAWNVENL